MKRKPKKNKELARLEPRKTFDKAIVGKLQDGTLIYSFHALIKIFMTINEDWSEETARDWIDYNVSCLPLVINYYK